MGAAEHLRLATTAVALKRMKPQQIREHMVWKDGDCDQYVALGHQELVGLWLGSRRLHNRSLPEKTCISLART